MRHHDREQFEVHVGCFSQAGGLLPADAIDGGRLTEYPVRRLYGVDTWRQQLRLAGYLRSRRIELIHTYGFYGNCFAIPAAFLARVPVIVASIRDVGASWTPRQLRIERWICRLADSILTNAEAVKKKLVADGYRADRIAVIRNGIDAAAFQRPARAAGFRRELGISPDAPLVGVIARIDAVKGLEHFVDAAALVSPGLPETRFVIIGGNHEAGPHVAYRRFLEGRVSERSLAGRLLFAGNRSDIPTILPQLSLCVLPSLSEGLPNVVLEAMAAGVPVIATDVGGTPEIIEDGVNGLLVPPGDPHSLAGAIGRLLRDPQAAHRLAVEGRVTVTGKFSIDGMVRCTENHYTTLLQGRAGRPGVRGAGATDGRVNVPLPGGRS